MSHDGQIEVDRSSVTLHVLIEQARANGKWLWCYYQDLWFSPDQLEAENREGRFRWDADNWKLRDPHERLAEARERTARAQAEEARIARAIGGI